MCDAPVAGVPLISVTRCAGEHALARRFLSTRHPLLRDLLSVGLAVGLSTVKSPQLGLVLCVAIFIHNVAEGIVVAGK